MLESFIISNEIDGNKSLEFIYNHYNKSLGFTQSPTDVKNKKDQVVIWYSKQTLNLIKNYEKERLNQLYKSKSIHFQEQKEYYDSLYGKEPIKEDTLLESLNTIKNKYKNELTIITDYIFSLNRNINNWKLPIRLSFDKAVSLSKNWHEYIRNRSEKVIDESEEKGKILKKYDDGFYWIDLLNNNCYDEGDLMGHCGRTSADTILSLRRIKNGKITAHVTIAVNIDNENNYNEIYQIKGKGNKKPSDKYHYYITDLLTSDSFIYAYFGLEEYDREEDFSPLDLSDKYIDVRLELFEGYVMKGLIMDDFLMSIYMESSSTHQDILKFIKENYMVNEHERYTAASIYIIIKYELLPKSIYSSGAFMERNDIIGFFREQPILNIRLSNIYPNNEFFYYNNDTEKIQIREINKFMMLDDDDDDHGYIGEIDLRWLGSIKGDKTEIKKIAIKYLNDNITNEQIIKTMNEYFGNLVSKPLGLFMLNSEEMFSLYGDYFVVDNYGTPDIFGAFGDFHLNGEFFYLMGKIFNYVKDGLLTVQ